jgi:hypothetical protein
MEETKKSKGKGWLEWLVELAVTHTLFLDNKASQPSHSLIG